jgi:hypothetical protein
MANRHPLGTKDVLNLSQHAGKALKATNVNSTPIDPNQSFGFVSGKFVAELTNAAGASAIFIPNYAIRVFSVTGIAKGTPGGGQSFTVSKVTTAGVTTVMYQITFAAVFGTIVPAAAWDAASTFAGLSLAQGDSIKIESAAGVTDGFQAIIEFYNI